MCKEGHRNEEMEEEEEDVFYLAREADEFTDYAGGPSLLVTPSRRKNRCIMQ